MSNHFQQKEIKSQLSDVIYYLQKLETKIDALTISVDELKRERRLTGRPSSESSDADGGDEYRIPFRFEDMAKMDDRSVRELLKSIENHTLVMSLKSAPGEVQNKIFSNLSERAAEIICEDMEALGSVRLTEVEKARKVIVTTAWELYETGNILIGQQDND